MSETNVEIVRRLYASGESMAPESFGIVFPEFFNADAVSARVSGTAKRTGTAVSVASAHALTLRDRRVARIEILLDRSEALKAVGLEQ